MGIPLKVSLGISAYRADLRGLFAHADVPAVDALPHRVPVLGEDQALFQILGQLAVALLVLLLDFGYPLEQGGDVEEALLPGLLGHGGVHVGPLEVLAGGGGLQVFGGDLQKGEGAEHCAGQMVIPLRRSGAVGYGYGMVPLDGDGDIGDAVEGVVENPVVRRGPAGADPLADAVKVIPGYVELRRPFQLVFGGLPAFLHALAVGKCNADPVQRGGGDVRADAPHGSRGRADCHQLSPVLQGHHQHGEVCPGPGGGDHRYHGQ